MKILKRAVFAASTVLLTLLLLLVFAELAARLYLTVRYSKADGSQILVLDDTYGWRVCPNYSFRGTRSDVKGQKHTIHIITDDNGFRVSRAPAADKSPTIMFVGDSFTMALDASDDSTYYGRLSELLNVNAYAYGAGGYGTLQELMVIKEFYAQVLPDVIVLQMCDNDIINNSYELEANSYRNNNAMRRPYADSSGKIFYAMPGGCPQQCPALRQAINKHSRLLYYVCSRIDRLRSRTGQSVEDTIISQGMRYPAYGDAIETTRRLLRQIRDAVPPSVRVLAFCVDDNKYLPRLAADSGMEVIPGVPEALAESKTRGVTIRAADGAHWTEDGHAVAALALYSYFTNHVSERGTLLTPPAMKAEPNKPSEVTARKFAEPQR